MSGDRKHVVSPASLKSGIRTLPENRWLPVRALGFSLVWALLITGLVTIELALANQGMTARTTAVVILFALGSFAGALFARALAAFLSRFRPQQSARFAAMFFGLITGTVGMTAFFHFLQFRSYYSMTHSDILTVHWAIEMIMTGANAVYIFMIESAMLLLPWGLPLALAAAWDYATAPIERKRQ
ncbi:hypothetical protein [Roseibium aggregatum]|uniref:Transmembrane protein n=1 Tax=Roseibium aggregatum TaxID=187304 RepID=A0A926P2Q0_9HYPH|nr:hypothetical protein [Roseibium aggregatum]MBD1548008.1 hypothetical protein [Roseibium aggregatum]